MVEQRIEISTNLIFVPICPFLPFKQGEDGAYIETQGKTHSNVPG